MADDVIARAVERDEVTRGFLERAAAVIDRAFGGWPEVALRDGVSAVDHLEWKASGTTPGFPAFLVAEVDGQLAGCRTVLVRRVLVRGEPKIFVHFVDAAVDPGFQGRGANRATQQLMHDVYQPQFDLSIDDSNNPHMIRGRRRLGGGTENFGNAVRPMVLPLDATRLVRADSEGEGGRLPTPLAALRLRAVSRLASFSARGARGPAPGCSIREVDRFDDRFDAFCAAATAPFDFVPERTEAFLNWRYADPRSGEFTIRVAERGDDLLGYVVLIDRDDTTHIADILVAAGEPAIAGALLDEVTRHARAAGTMAVSGWLAEHHPYRAAFRARGFVPMGGTSIVYRAVAMPAEELAFLERSDAAMHFTYGDTDFI